jgi:hypothetical protein
VSDTKQPAADETVVPRRLDGLELALLQGKESTGLPIKADGRHGYAARRKPLTREQESLGGFRGRGGWVGLTSRQTRGKTIPAQRCSAGARLNHR